MPPKQRKIAVMGSRSVGKSSLAIQFVQGQFVDSYDPTIENTFSKNLKYKGQEYDVLVVDTAGQDEYSIFPTQYSVDIDGYILVYSIDSEQSFEVVQVIYDKLVDLVGNPNVPLVLVGNKNDLHNDRRVTQDSGRKLAGEMKAVFLETSAKDHHCASDIFIKSLIQIEKNKVKEWRRRRFRWRCCLMWCWSKSCPSSLMIRSPACGEPTSSSTGSAARCSPKDSKPRKSTV